MKLQILDKAKKKKFIVLLDYFGIEKIPYLLFKAGKERVRAYSGSLSKDELFTLLRLLRVDSIGLYLGREIVRRDGRKEGRLSVDGLHVLKEEVKDNIVGVNEKQADDWFRGKDVELEKGQTDCKGFVALKYGNDFIGSGRVSGGGEFVSNFMPRERRVRSRD